MSTPILATKLFIPPPRPKVVLRPRLIERLNEGLGHNQGFARKLTLISAPAGFGKTTLVSEWLAGSGAPKVAWLSLDEGDGDLARFVAYLIAALQTISPHVGEGVLGLLQSPQPPPTESILTALLNEITAFPEKIVLALDDYHVLDAKTIDNTLTFLLEHLPPQMHLAITTRVDPDLPLARYRVRGQLTELRATELRFTPAEAAGFLNQVMGLNLSTEEIATLETRTEGWIAGLQMAALSMQGSEDISGFIRAFAGHDRYIVDYLAEEVLQRQSERVRSFLLQTSILDRLSGPLCDAVTGQGDGKGMLESLERGNLFVVPLDDKRQWYRYHHLFADVLHAHAMEEQPEQVLIRHRRASEWYEHNGSTADAVRHALAAEDFEQAAALVELAIPAMETASQSATWLGWMRALPDELVRARPVLSVAYASALLDGGELEAAEDRLRDAERWLDAAADEGEQAEVPASKMVVVDKEQFQSLPATIAISRAYLAQALGDMLGTVKYARCALDLLAEDDYRRRGIPAALMGFAHWASGDLEAAHRSFADFMMNMRRAGNIPWAFGPTYILADITLAQGRLREALSIYEQSLQVVTQQEAVMPGTAELYLGLSELHREQGNLAAAREYLLSSEEIGEKSTITLQYWQYCLCLAQARIKEDQGDLDGALDLFQQAERLYFRNPQPDVRPVAALKTRVWVKQDRLTEALGWAREQGLSVDDDLSYLREFEHVTLARVLIARYKSDRAVLRSGTAFGRDRAIHEAQALLDRLLEAAEEGGRMRSVIEILSLHALAHQAQGNIPLALAALECGPTLAEPEGYVRHFVDEGSPMAQLLSEAASHGIMPDYTGELLAVFEAEKQKSEDRFYLPPAPPAQPLVEPLSTIPATVGTEDEGTDVVRETNGPEESIDRSSHISASGWIPWDRLRLGGSPWETLRKVGTVLGLLSALVALSLNSPRLWKARFAPEEQEPAMQAPPRPTTTLPSATATPPDPTAVLPMVTIDGPAIAPLGEKTYFTIVSENAIRAEWTASGFQGNEVVLVETLSPLFEIYVEPLDATRVGDSFTILVTVFDSEGQSAVARKRFQVVSD